MKSYVLKNKEKTMENKKLGRRLYYMIILEENRPYKNMHSVPGALHLYN